MLPGWRARHTMASHPSSSGRFVSDSEGSAAQLCWLALKEVIGPREYTEITRQKTRVQKVKWLRLVRGQRHRHFLHHLARVENKMKGARARTRARRRGVGLCYPPAYDMLSLSLSRTASVVLAEARAYSSESLTPRPPLAPPSRASRRIAAAIRRRAPALTAFATLLLAVSAPVASAQSYSYSYFYETVTFAPSAAPIPAPTALPIPAPIPAPTATAVAPAPTAAPVVLAVTLTVVMDCADCEFRRARARFGAGRGGSELSRAPRRRRPAMGERLGL